MNYKCSFPEEWLGLEKEELIQATGLQSALFCHKGGFLMTTGTMEDAMKACVISLQEYQEESRIVSLGGRAETEELLRQLPGLQNARIVNVELPEIPELEVQGVYGEVAMEKAQWKNLVKEQVKKILKFKPEAVYVEGNTFSTYPIIHILRKKHIPVLSAVQKDGKTYIVRIPSGS